MSKPNPYFSNEKEREEINRLSESFIFNSIEERPKSVILIAGKEGSGKTHLACTMSEREPVYIIDTEYRAQIVARKFKNVQFATVKSYRELVIAMKHIVKHQPSGTIVIDSASDLQTFAEIEYLERTKKESVYPIFNWGDVWALCNAVIDDIKFSGKFNLILTARVKEEYIADKPTGRIIPRIYASLPYKSDIVLQYGNDSKLTLLKNGFTGDLRHPVDPKSGMVALMSSLSDTAVQSTHEHQSSTIIPSPQPQRRVITMRQAV